MKRPNKEIRPLVLKRETIKVLDEQALRQVEGGAKAGSSSKMMVPNQR